MNTWPVALASPGLLVAAVVFARVSGNDKAPFLVMGAVLIGAVIVALLLVGTLMSKSPPSGAWTRCTVAGAPLVYVGLVVVLTRKGWIDSMGWLGFR